MLVLGTSGHANDRHKKLANQHSEGAIYENGTPAELLNGIERDRGAADVHESGDNANQEWVADRL